MGIMVETAELYHSFKLIIITYIRMYFITILGTNSQVFWLSNV